MATERTVMTPSGIVIHVTEATQTVMAPDGVVVDAKIEAAAPAGGLNSLPLLGVG